MILPIENWFYARGGQQTGPVTLEQLRNLLLNGHIDRDRDLVWAEGIEDWKPASKIEGLVPTVQAAPVYDAPGYVPDPAQAGPPVPFVKRANFGLLMALGISAFLLLFAGGALAAYGIFQASGFGGGFTAIAVVGIILALLGLCLLIATVIIFFIYLFRAWLVIQPFHVRTTPGLAVGLCFVPLFNLYWVFQALHGWAFDYNRVVASQPAFHMAPRANVGLFLTYCILTAATFCIDIAGGAFGSRPLEAVSNLMSIVGLVLLLVMAAQICAAVNFFAAFHSQPDRR